ncbi:MAG: restriction endonuclease subunit S, partial [Atopobiaceae bacterium]|nr:restriction endonuclease subunit S [Atopobiaceae bacterium]
MEAELPFGLPQGWEWARLGSISDEPRYGTSRKSDPVGATPVLRMGNITRNGTIDYGDLVYTSNPVDISKFALKAGDVLFNRTNSREWVGKTAYYDGHIPAIYAGYLVRFTPLIILGEFVNYAMCAPYEREWCSSVKTDGVNQSNINVQKLKQFLLPVPPLAEQRRIVAALDELLG